MFGRWAREGLFFDYFLSYFIENFTFLINLSCGMGCVFCGFYGRIKLFQDINQTLEAMCACLAE